jgi:hypothetical protein
MKINLLLIVGLLVTGLALMAAPVSATTATGTTALTGTVTSYVAISLNESTILLGYNGLPTMTPGNTATNASLSITISSNAPGFSVSVSDNSGRTVGGGFAATDLGHMGNFTDSAYDAFPLNTTLASALGLAGTTNGTTSEQTLTPPITTGSPLYSGTAAVTSQLLAPNTFSQYVAVTDPVLPDPSTYRIDLLFTIYVP